MKFLEAKYEYFDFLDANNKTQSTLIYNVTSLRSAEKSNLLIS